MIRVSKDRFVVGNEGGFTIMDGTGGRFTLMVGTGGRSVLAGVLSVGEQLKKMRPKVIK